VREKATPRNEFEASDERRSNRQRRGRQIDSDVHDEESAVAREIAHADAGFLDEAVQMVEREPPIEVA
jgi:hypothetical protein